MTLLKNDGTAPNKSYNVSVQSWPEDRKSEGVGLSINDGWYFGIGLGLAMTIAVPFILLMGSLIILAIIAIFGSL
jgi:hypothetical protein